MKLLYVLGFAAALLFLAIGLYGFGKVARADTDLGFCLTGLISAPSLALVLYVIHTGRRIDALEKRGQEPK